MADELRFSLRGEHLKATTCKLISHPPMGPLCEEINFLSSKLDTLGGLAYSDSLIVLNDLRSWLASSLLRNYQGIQNGPTQASSILSDDSERRFVLPKSGPRWRKVQ